MEIALTKSKSTQNTKYNVSDMIKNTKFSCNNNSSEFKTALSIKNKCLENKVVLTRADKGNSIVALEREDYIAKSNEFLKTYEKLKKDPTLSFQTEIKSALEATKTLFSNFDKKKNGSHESPTPYNVRLSKVT